MGARRPAKIPGSMACPMNPPKLAEKRLKNEKEPAELYHELDFFDTVGLLVKRGYLNESDVWETFSYWVFNLNADARGIIEQGQRGDPTYYATFTSLVERLQRVEADQHGPNARPSKDEVKDFYREELTVGIGTPIQSHARLARRKP